MIYAITCLVVGLAAVTSTAPAGQAPKETPVARHASGTFDVKLTPQEDEGVGDQTIGRMSIDKQYHGDLEGSGLGQMLAGMGEVKESGPMSQSSACAARWAGARARLPCTIAAS
jgi:hypothetical protein